MSMPLQVLPGRLNAPYTGNSVCVDSSELLGTPKASMPIWNESRNKLEDGIC